MSTLVNVTCLPAIDSNTWLQDPDNPHHSFRYIREYTPPGVIKRIGGGNSCFVGIHEDGSVLKYLLVKGEGARSLAVEKDIYHALGHHERIIRCLGITDDGLKLELASEGSISHYLGKTPTPSIEIRLKWSRQAAEAVAFIHSKGVVHCDIHTNNLLLDSGLNVKLSDFQGTFKDLDGYAMESVRYFLPREMTSPPTVVTDLFALGTAIYTIMTGVEPYPELSEVEVEEHYRRHKFPDVSAIIYGKMVQRCWN